MSWCSHLLRKQPLIGPLLLFNSPLNIILALTEGFAHIPLEPYDLHHSQPQH